MLTTRTAGVRSRSVIGFAFVACLIASGLIAQTQSPRLDLPPVQEDSIPPELCGTEFVYLQSLGLATPLALDDGQGLMFDQTPAIIRPDLSGSFSIKVQLVGDFPTMRFKRWDPEATGENIETWSRTATRTISGRLVSIFDKVYPDSELARILRRGSWGFDNAGLFWGQVLLPNSDKKPGVTLRVGSTNLPTATPAVRLSANVQYAGSVVNIRIPDFGDTRVVDGDFGFDLRTAAKTFYEFFPDSYEMIAFIPQSGPLADYGAFHRIVKNEVTGIGLRTFDTTSDYGSGGTLQGVEVYTGARFTTNDVSNHEITHQWGHYLDLTGLAAVAGKGHQPESHTPLTLGATMLGAVLEATREVARTTGTSSSFEIGRTSYPILHHPLEMYVMGKTSSDVLGTQLVFDDQGQFDATTSAAPDVGTTLKGGVKEVTVGAILGKHGSRGGPSPTVIRRATVLVSRDALASQAEMDYWNFYAQRLADPNRTGVPSYEGYVSFDRATRNLVDLRTDISPIAGGAPGTAVEVTAPRFGRRDWRGVEFNDTVPSRFVAGQRVTLAGRIIATDRSDFDNVLVRFWKYGGNADDAVRVFATVTRSGTFTVDVNFTQAQRGLYEMEVFLFWPSSGSQFPRGLVTPILVE
jgi:hypothetical protein